MVLSPPRTRRRVAPGVRRTAPVPGSSPGSVIPFDSAASFSLTGLRGNVVQSAITIGPEGTFIALAIGYGFEEERGRPAQIVPAEPAPPLLLPGDVTLGQIPVTGLIQGLRAHPDFQHVLFPQDDTGGSADR